MDLSLDPEQQQMQTLAHRFAQEHIRPIAAHYDETGEMPWPLLEKANEVGLLSFGLPSEFGGGGIAGGLVGVTNFVVMEELGWGCAGIATVIGSSIYAAGPILAFGTKDQQQRYVSMFCDPDHVRLGAVCITEPQGGSDVAGMQTTFRRDRGSWVLNGTKCFITNGGIADVHIVFAVERPGGGWNAMAGFIVDKGTPGLRMGRVEKKLGVRASHTAEVVLTECRIPLENRLGWISGEGGYSSGGDSSGGDTVPEYGSSPTGESSSKGKAAQENGPTFAKVSPLMILQYSRMTFAATAVGLARAAFEYALDYARNRRSFGQPIARHQAVAHKLADMATEIDAARLLLWRAGSMTDNGVALARAEGSMAKLFSAEVAVRATREAVQILGGHGYMSDHPVEKWYRDAKVYEIWEGTSEIQREVISRALTGPPSATSERGVQSL